METQEKWAFIVLRFGLGLTFLYAAVAMYTDPQGWVGYVPTWVTTVMSREVFLLIHTIIEFIFGIAFIINFKVRWIALFATLDLLALLVFYGVDDVTFRDMGLLMSALALFLLSGKKQSPAMQGWLSKKVG